MIPRDKCIHYDNTLFLARCRSQFSKPSSDRNVAATLCGNYSLHIDQTFASGTTRTSMKASRPDAHTALTITSKSLMLLEPFGPPHYWSTHSQTEHKISRPSHGHRKCLKIEFCHVPDPRRDHEGTRRIKSPEQNSTPADDSSHGMPPLVMRSSVLARTVHVILSR